MRVGASVNGKAKNNDSYEKMAVTHGMNGNVSLVGWQMGKTSPETESQDRNQRAKKV